MADVETESVLDVGSMVSVVVEEVEVGGGRVAEIMVEDVVTGAS